MVTGANGEQVREPVLSSPTSVLLVRGRVLGHQNR